MHTTSEVTRLLQEVQAGTPGALDRLLPVIYDELRGLAHQHLRRNQATLSTTALVHEAYLKLFDGQELAVAKRRYFFGAAARAMRQILIDAARQRKAAKRGGDAVHLSLDDADVAVDACADDLLALDTALAQLEALDPQLARVVEHRFFAGQTVEETAEAMDVSTRTVKRLWRKARALLYQALQPSE